MKALHVFALAALLALVGCKKKNEEGGEATEATETETETETPPEPEAEPEPEPEPEKKMATAEVKAASESEVAGTVSFEATDGGVKVTAKITGLKPGDHGFHIHETGDCSAPDAKSAGGHFNPASVDHGAPDGETHHAGDFGNITANEEGVAEATWTVDFISLEEGAENGVVGRAVVVHEKADDLKSQPSGDAGARIGCGVIAADG